MVDRIGLVLAAYAPRINYMFLSNDYISVYIYTVYILLHMNRCYCELRELWKAATTMRLPTLDESSYKNNTHYALCTTVCTIYILLLLVKYVHMYVHTIHTVRAHAQLRSSIIEVRSTANSQLEVEVLA